MKIKGKTKLVKTVLSFLFGSQESAIAAGTYLNTRLVCVVLCGFSVRVE